MRGVAASALRPHLKTHSGEKYEMKNEEGLTHALCLCNKCIWIKVWLTPSLRKTLPSLQTSHTPPPWPTLTWFHKISTFKLFLKTHRLKEDIAGHMCPGHSARTVSRHTNSRWIIQVCWTSLKAWYGIVNHCQSLKKLNFEGWLKSADRPMDREPSVSLLNCWTQCWWEMNRNLCTASPLVATAQHLNGIPPVPPLLPPCKQNRI